MERRDQNPGAVVARPAAYVRGYPPVAEIAFWRVIRLIAIINMRYSPVNIALSRRVYRPIGRVRIDLKHACLITASNEEKRPKLCRLHQKHV